MTQSEHAKARAAGMTPTEAAKPTQPEAFVELLPPDVGHNLRHLGPERAHVTGEECHCSPERIPHPTQGTSRSVSARVVRASEAQVEAALDTMRQPVPTWEEAARAAEIDPEEGDHE